MNEVLIIKIAALFMMLAGIYYILYPYKALTVWGCKKLQLPAIRTGKINANTIKIMTLIIRLGGISLVCIAIWIILTAKQ